MNFLNSMDLSSMRASSTLLQTKKVTLKMFIEQLNTIYNHKLFCRQYLFSEESIQLISKLIESWYKNDQSVVAVEYSKGLMGKMTNMQWNTKLTSSF